MAITVPQNDKASYSREGIDMVEEKAPPTGTNWHVWKSHKRYVSSGKFHKQTPNGSGRTQVSQTVVAEGTKVSQTVVVELKSHKR